MRFVIYLINQKNCQNFCFPGNAGTELIAENVNLDLDNFSELEKLCTKRK